MADKEVTCAKINTRNKNQWQTGGEREPGINKRIKGTEAIWGIQDHMISVIEKMVQRTEHTEIPKEVTEIQRRKKIDTKQNKFSENLQHSWPAVVARGGYTQIVVNPMQLEDEAFTAWMQRLTEAIGNRENRVPQRPYRNFCKPVFFR